MMNINDFLEETFFPRLRDKIGITEDEVEEGEMYDIADYINWAVKHGYKLNFYLTEDDLNLIEAAD